MPRLRHPQPLASLAPELSARWSKASRGANTINGDRARGVGLEDGRERCLRCEIRRSVGNRPRRLAITGIAVEAASGDKARESEERVVYLVNRRTDGGPGQVDVDGDDGARRTVS